MNVDFVEKRSKTDDVPTVTEFSNSKFSLSEDFAQSFKQAAILRTPKNRLERPADLL